MGPLTSLFSLIILIDSASIICRSVLFCFSMVSRSSEEFSFIGKVREHMNDNSNTQFELCKPM